MRKAKIQIGRKAHVVLLFHIKFIPMRQVILLPTPNPSLAFMFFSSRLVFHFLVIHHAFIKSALDYNKLLHLGNRPLALKKLSTQPLQSPTKWPFKSTAPVISLLQMALPTLCTAALRTVSNNSVPLLKI